jgi:hypothetical protein
LARLSAQGEQTGTASQCGAAVSDIWGWVDMQHIDPSRAMMHKEHDDTPFILIAEPNAP